MTQKPISIKLKKSEDQITAHSGLFLVGEALHKFEIMSELQRTLPKPNSNRGKEPTTYILPTLLSMAGGGRTVEDVQKLFSDKVLLKALALQQFDASTQYKWFDKNGERMTPLINRVHQHHVTKALSESGHTSFTVDIDAMMIESNKKNAKKTYKYFSGYNTMLGFFAETAHCGYQDFRPGNVSPAKGILESLKSMRALCPQGTDIHRFRSDSAGWSRKVIGYCEDTNISYTITADSNSATKEAIANIPNNNWKPLLDEKGKPTGREYAETVYCFNNFHKAHRLIVQRASDQQMDMFSDGKQRHYVISSNFDDSFSSVDIIRFHQKRGQAENYNKELKYSLNLTYVPSNSLSFNRLWFALAILVYNLFQTLKTNYLPESWKHKKIATLRWQLIQIPAKLTFHARQWTLSLAGISQDIFEIIMKMRLKLCNT